ncbi:MAG TPA: lysophospholipid acyltransferase family protein [Thermodesulfobacteriota bacterium]|nr:lysophospholipid acyltransferase family protein [Thermodesulfobacteriota bacterium]
MNRNSVIYSVTKGIARLAFSVVYRIEAEKRTTLPNHGPMIILPKHQYWTDIPIVSLVFESLLYFVAKKELFKYPLIRGTLSLLGGLPVDRKQSIRTLDSFKALVSLLRAGEKIVIFPEGTYFRNGVGSGKSRLLQMILKFQSELGYPVPFIPVGIRYGERTGCRRRIEVCIGTPLFAEGESDAVSLTHRAMEEISHLCHLPLNQSSEFGVQGSELEQKTLRAPN